MSLIKQSTKQKQLANERFARNKARNQSNMRDKVNFARSWNEIETIENDLHDRLQAGEEFKAATVQAIKVLLGSKWRKIDKLLPNLQSVAIDMDSTETVNQNIAIAFINTDADTIADNRVNKLVNNNSPSIHNGIDDGLNKLVDNDIVAEQ